MHERIAFCWSQMDAQLTPGRYLLGDEHPKLHALWARRFAED